MDQIQKDELAAVIDVITSGCYSGYLAGTLHGGPQVEALEEEWANTMGFKHAVAMNSATSCLTASLLACEVGRSCRVAVPPLTMSASAACILHVGAKPVFADIEEEYFCLDPAVLKPDGLSAIITVDLFGQLSNPELRSICDEKKIVLIQDASQRPLPGGFGDIVVYSLNYHKHIQCGEGGIACTDSDYLAKQLRLIRNHGECSEDSFVVGYNYRLTELQAAIARAQLKYLDFKLAKRRCDAREFETIAPTRPNSSHAWYLYPHLTQVEGSFKYQKPLYNLRLFKERPEKYPVTERVYEKLWMTKP